jgi:hypothetical protein
MTYDLLAFPAPIFPPWLKRKACSNKNGAPSALLSNSSGTILSSVLQHFILATGQALS